MLEKFNMTLLSLEKDQDKRKNQNIHSIHKRVKIKKQKIDLFSQSKFNFF